MAIVKFVWLMNKKTLVGVHRLEEEIHHRFDQLVEAGFLRKAPGHELD